MIRMLKLLAVTSAVLASSAPLALASSSPTVTTGAVTSIGDTSAVLNGTVNPNGAATTYQFQWGLTTAYGLLTPGWHARRHETQHRGQGDDPRSAAWYQRTTTGWMRSTQPAPGPAAAIPSGPPASLRPVPRRGRCRRWAVQRHGHGTISPEGANTTWYVQYGLTSAYGTQTFGATASVTPDDAPVTVSAPLSGLQPGATFHYRFVAVHAGSVPQYGADATFQTQPWPAPVPRLIASTTPSSARHAPFAFSTFGRIVRPASDPASKVCRQRRRFVLPRQDARGFAGDNDRAQLHILRDADLQEETWPPPPCARRQAPGCDPL